MDVEQEDPHGNLVVAYKVQVRQQQVEVEDVLVEVSPAIGVRSQSVSSKWFKTQESGLSQHDDYALELLHDERIGAKHLDVGDGGVQARTLRPAR